MATQVVMPKLSPTMEEGQIARWIKSEGDKVSIGEPIAEIDTDKATMEMQALSTGILLKILVKEGESVPLGQIIGIIGEPDEDISALLSSASSASKPAEQTSPAAESAPDAGTAPPAKPPETTGEKAAVKAPPADGEPLTSPVAAESDATPQTGRLIVSPLAARMAAEAGIDLRSLKGTGPSGRIIKRDIEAATSNAASGGSTKPASAAASPSKPPVIEGASTFRDVPATEIRRTIAKRLVTSIGPVPHFFLTTEIEMERAAELRHAVIGLDPNLKISFNDIIIKVAANALILHPQVNSSYQDRTVRYYDRADIGVAVAIEDGLITPIIRGANEKSIGQIAVEIREKAERARSKKLHPDEYLGATFSVSNLGMFGIDEFTAVINPPEAAILAIGAISAKPVVRDGQVVVRQMMRVTMSCDHRVVDGATGAKFLQTFKSLLETPALLLI